jgi:16S rRNA (guanine527-N7)-methyltransferase
MTGETVEGAVESALRLAGFSDAGHDTKMQLAAYAREVGAWSGRVHLVGRERLRSNLGLLVLDSLLLLRVGEGAGLRMGRAADIGSGAGFPGVVWKIVRPNLDMTFFERRLKPQLFLERVKAFLGLGGVNIVGADAAEYGQPGVFDVVVSKAAGRLSQMLPIAERLLGPDGGYITIKGDAWRSEIPSIRRGAMLLDSVTELAESRGAALIFRKKPVA